jgi:glyoxylase-like metal-dependent hydrolase (beta-lactamase superfamily II)
MAGIEGPAHVTAPVAALATELPSWATLLRAPNPGPMTLDGTNTWLLRLPGEQTYAVDPGPLDEGHLQAVAAAGPLAGILLTHGHPDHVEGVDRLVEITGAPVVTWPASDGPAGDGPAGDGPASNGPAGVERIPAPGHTSDSVCFLIDVDGERAVLTGDTILGRGTTVVAFPDGDLGDYLDSLRRLERFGRIPVLPGHGPALADCAAAARYYLDHRHARLEQVRAALAAGAGTASEVVEMVYADVDRSLWPWAELSVRAQLAYLESRPHGVRWDTS